MKYKLRPFTGCKTLISAALAITALAQPAFAGPTDIVTLIEMGDLHGTLVPHQAIMKRLDGTEYESASAGGLARLKTIVDDIRYGEGGNPEAVLLSAGDLTHGSAEGMFTVGDAMLIPMNAFGIDVFTPGNWDFGYGGAVFRNHFTPISSEEFPIPYPKPPLPGNIRVMSGYIGCDDVPEIEGLTDGDYSCTEMPPNASTSMPPYNGVIKANFDSVAANIYNAAPLPAGLHDKRILPPYKMLNRNGVEIAVIGITASIVPQQADTFNIGIRFTQGVEELPALIEEVKGKGAELIVVQSELGLSQNIKLAQSFEDIDVMYSAHTHEVTLGAFLVNDDDVIRTTPGGELSNGERRALSRGAAIVVETNRDMYVGRLDLEISGGNITDFTWEAIPADESVDEDEDMAELVAAMEAGFVAGEDFINHSFEPGGFIYPGSASPADTGLRLTEDLDTIVGYTDTLLLRHHVLEDTLNNFIADGILAVSNSVSDVYGVPGWENGVDISMANGFRFGNAVLPPNPDCETCGVITLRDLYTWFPIAPAVNIADFSGQSIQNSLNTILGAVFNRNVFQQRGGWYLGLANMEQTIDLKNRPFSSSSGRIVQTRIGGQPLDLGKRYVFASCYGHGNPLDDVCRTGGGANFKFFQLEDGDDYTSDITLADPVNTEAIIVGPAVKQVAPNNFLHPVHALRRYLDSLPGNTVTEAQFGADQGRVVLVDSSIAPLPGVDITRTISEQIGQPDNTPDTTLVQPPFGAGPKFFSGVISH